MLLGLKMTPVAIQRAMDVVLFPVKRQPALVYLDDTSAFSKNVSNVMAHLWQALALLGNAEVTLKLKKCSFFAKKTNCLVPGRQPGRLELSKATTTTVLKLSDPTTESKQRSFLSFATYFAIMFQSFQPLQHSWTNGYEKATSHCSLPLQWPKMM